MQPCPACGQKEILVNALNQARLHYAAKTLTLEEITSRAAFKRAVSDVENARIAYERARKALKAHVKEHGC